MLPEKMSQGILLCIKKNMIMNAKWHCLESIPSEIKKKTFIFQTFPDIQNSVLSLSLSLLPSQNYRAVWSVAALNTDCAVCTPLHSTVVEIRNIQNYIPIDKLSSYNSCLHTTLTHSHFFFTSHRRNSAETLLLFLPPLQLECLTSYIVTQI